MRYSATKTLCRVLGSHSRTVILMVRLLDLMHRLLDLMRPLLVHMYLDLIHAAPRTVMRPPIGHGARRSRAHSSADLPPCTEGRESGGSIEGRLFAHYSRPCFASRTGAASCYSARHRPHLPY